MSRNSKKYKCEKSAASYFFTKATTSVIGTNEEIDLHRDVTSQVDYEGELGVIIGRKCIDVLEKDALKYVYGYTIINDITARDLQNPTPSGSEEKAWIPSAP